jgi:hypothetical protein
VETESADISVWLIASVAPQSTAVLIRPASLVKTNRAISQIGKPRYPALHQRLEKPRFQSSRTALVFGFRYIIYNQRFLHQTDCRSLGAMVARWFSVLHCSQWYRCTPKVEVSSSTSPRYTFD